MLSTLHQDTLLVLGFRRKQQTGIRSNREQDEIVAGNGGISNLAILNTESTSPLKQPKKKRKWLRGGE